MTKSELTAAVEAADRYKHMETELEEPKNQSQEEMGVE